jgi:hypothetical protein
MTENARYYALSTIAQVAGTLAALIGFLGLWRLDRLKREMEEVERELRRAAALRRRRDGGVEPLESAQAVVHWPLPRVRERAREILEDPLGEPERKVYIKAKDDRMEVLPREQRLLMWVLCGFLMGTLMVILAPAIVGIVQVDWLKTWAWTATLLYAASAWLAIAPTCVVLMAARSTRVLFVLALLPVAWLAFGARESHAASPSAPRPTEVWPVEVAFREAVQLWADERFDALWERGLLASRYRVSREAFAHWMRHRVIKPTCCWGQLRAVQVHLRGAEEAVAEAQAGVDVKTLGTTVVRSMVVYLRREDGEWRVALEDFMTKPDAGLPWSLPGLGWMR